MIIDETIYAAIDAGTLTVEQVCTTVLQVWDEIEDAALKHVAAEAVAAGFAEADIRLAIEGLAYSLRENRARRLEGARVCLERELARELVH